MLNFFKGRKRKAGCVTLVLACLAMLALLRGDFVSDFIDISDSFVIANDKGSLGLMVVRIHSRSPSEIQRYCRWDSESPNAMDGFAKMFRRVRKYKQFDVLGIGYSLWKVDTNRGPIDFYLFELSFMSLIIPLTLLSAWLLLSRPRPVKAKSP